MFKDILKQLRTNAGLTQTDFAKKLHMSHGAVGMWETGARTPDAETLKKIAQFFGVPVDYLLGLISSPTFIEQGEDAQFPEAKIRSKNPVSILVAQYHLSTDVLATIIGVDYSVAESWILGTTEPTRADYSAIADFFNVDVTDLQNGRLPLFPDEAVQHRLELAKGKRFAAYGKTGEFTSDELRAIDEFIGYIKSKRGSSPQ